MKEQLQSYSKDMTIAIVIQDEHRKAEIARIRERYQRKISKRKQDVGDFDPFFVMFSILHNQNFICYNIS